MSKIKTISFIDLTLPPKSKRKIKEGISNLINKNSFIGGEELQKFNVNFSKYNNSKYCLGVANGTDALEIALESLNLPKNAEIIVPNFTFLSPAEAVVRGGYKLVLADINLKDFTISIDSVKALISKKTSAIIVVHLFGNPCNMSEILKLTRKENLKLIEDCSQAHGAKFNGKNVGNFGDIGTFSFYPTKNLGAFGDSGAIVTNNKKTYERVKKISNHGRIDTYDHSLAGRNSRLDSIQAFVLNEKLKSLDIENLSRISQAECFLNKINAKDIKKMNLNKSQFSVFHQFPILTKKRDALLNFLKKRGISAGVYYPKPLSKMQAFRNLVSKNKFHDLNSKVASKNILSLPIGPHLDIKDAEYITNAIQSFRN